MLLPSQVLPQLDQSALTDTIQRNICAGEISAFDIEKYLKSSNLSATSDSSEVHATFDLSGWAESLSSSQRSRQAEHLAKQENKEFSSSTNSEEKDQRGGVSISNRRSSEVPLYDDQLAANSSSAPCPRASLRSSRMTVDLGQSSSLRSSADKLNSCDNAASSTRTQSFSGRTQLQTDTQPGHKDLKTANVSSEHDYRSLPRTSPRGSKQQPGLKASSPSSQRLRSVGQELQDKPGDFPQKKPSGNLKSPKSVGKHAGISCLNSQPPQNSTSGNSQQNI